MMTKGLDNISRFGRQVLFACAGALLVAAQASAGTPTKEKIEARLQKAGLGAADIQVEVKGDCATLRGVTLTLEEKRGAARAARKEAKTVTNLIRVLPEARKDADIRKDARRAVLSYPYYSIFDNVDLGVEDGVVLLRGSVTNDVRKSDIEAAVAHVPGIRDLKSEMTVQSGSPFDSRLRRQIYSAIYGDRLQSFAGRADGPVHIVVDNGRVTLTGWVNSNVDRQVFGAIANSTLAFAVDNRIKVDGEPPEADQKKSLIEI